MFWKFTLNSSHLDALLDNEEVVLHEILDEEDVLQECKGQNKRLLEYLSQSEIMEELIDLALTEPAEDSDEKSRYKYPNLACELLTCDVTSINERLSQDEALLNKIYCFLERDAPLNPLLASFFSKVFCMLISRRSEDMAKYIKNKDNFISLALNHLGTSAVMDLILRLITCIDNAEVRLAVITWLNDQQLIQKLIALIDPLVPEEKHFNVSQLLCDIARAGREQLSQLMDAGDSDPLLDTLEHPETVGSLLTHMLGGDEINGPVVINGLAIIQTLIEFRKSIPFGMDPEQMPQVEDERHQRKVNAIIGAIIPHMTDLHQILLTPPQQTYSPMSTTVGVLEPPLGNARLQIARLITSIVGTNSVAANNKLAELGSISVLMDLYHRYVWNNFLHTQVTRCLSFILLNGPCKDNNDELSFTLVDQLLNDNKLIEKVLEWWDENDQIQLQEFGHRRGYVGHLIKTANDLAGALEKGPMTEHLKQLLENRPKDIQDRWEAFVNGPLAETNKKNRIDLVGPHPLQSSSEDDDAEFRNIPFPSEAHLQQAFADYQLQQMTSTFIDQFGFSEEEFGENDENVTAPFNTKIDFSINTDEEPPNAALFERACNERIQQFDDPDSDEDVWDERNLSMPGPGGIVSEKSPGGHPVHQRHAGQSDEDSSSDEDLDSPAVIRQTPSTDTDDKSLLPDVPHLNTEQMDIDSEAWPNDDRGLVAMDTTPSAWVATNDKSADSTWGNFARAPKDSSEAWANFDQNTSNSDESWANFSDFTAMETIQDPKSVMDVSEPCPPNSRLAAYAVDSMDTNTNGAGQGDLSIGDVADKEPVNATSPTAATPPRSPNHTVVEDADLQDNFNFLSQAGLIKSDDEPSPKTVKTEQPSDSNQLNSTA